MDNEKSATLMRNMQNAISDYVEFALSNGQSEKEVGNRVLECLYEASGQAIDIDYDFDTE